uniref:Uncharacterized protein n=1 Tax=Lotharella oceanica TaxID=641309 RepID=A0A7S2XDQ9_9EUKA|mmetsp:Transcript_26581/g.49667  ORF Transcript_26581/g.49667 Transcript_26581/m.49667 type:complete len:182 (+) Transcript_26581:10-555(+)
MAPAAKPWVSVAVVALGLLCGCEGHAVENSDVNKHHRFSPLSAIKKAAGSVAKKLSGDSSVGAGDSSPVPKGKLETATDYDSFPVLGTEYSKWELNAQKLADPYHSTQPFWGDPPKEEYEGARHVRRYQGRTETKDWSLGLPANLHSMDEMQREDFPGLDILVNQAYWGHPAVDRKRAREG